MKHDRLILYIVAGDVFTYIQENIAHTRRIKKPSDGVINFFMGTGLLIEMGPISQIARLPFVLFSLLSLL